MQQRNGSRPQARQRRERSADTDREHHVSAEVKLDARNPIPFENGNFAYSSQGGQKYIPFFPPKDDFVQTLLEARTQSPTLGACVRTKTDYTIGGGIFIANLAQGSKEPQDWIDWTKSVNNKRQSLNRVVRNCIDSFYATGNVPIEITRTTVAGKKFVYIYRRNLLDCRFLWPDDDYSMEPTHVVVSRSFRKKNFIPNEKNWKKIPIYKGDKKSSWLVDDKGVERTFLWLRNELTGFDFYGMPSWIEALLFAVLEYEGGRYNLDNLENNMVVDAILTLAGNLSQKEAQRIGKQIIAQHTGKGKRGRVAVIASEDGIKESNLQNLQTHKDGSYENQDKLCEKKILLASQWNAELAGLEKASALGKGAGYLQELLDQAYETVIGPMVRTIIEELLNPLIEILGWMNPSWKTFQLDIKPTQISQRNSEAATTVDGLNAFLDIIRLVASGAYPLDAAIQLVMDRYGKTEAEAKKLLGNIQKMDPNAIPQPTPKSGSNNSGRGN